MAVEDRIGTAVNFTMFFFVLVGIAQWAGLHVRRQVIGFCVTVAGAAMVLVVPFVSPFTVFMIDAGGEGWLSHLVVLTTQALLLFVLYQGMYHQAEHYLREIC